MYPKPPDANEWWVICVYLRAWLIDRELSKRDS